MKALGALSAWPVRNAAAAVLTDGRVVATAGDIERRFALASVTKPLVAWAALVAAEEGIIALDEPVGAVGAARPVGPAGAPVDAAPVTVRHLLAHASGLPFEGSAPVAAPGTRRIYSNTGFNRLGALVADAAQMSFAEYLDAAVCVPLGMAQTTLDGPPASGATSTVADVARFVGELVTPRLITHGTADAARAVQFPDLAGVVPGVGRYSPCDWGLGVEIKGAKDPHWTGRLNSPGTFGHFGGAGTFVWVDLGAHTAMVVLTDRPFRADEALQWWPALSDAVLVESGLDEAGA